MEIGTSFIAFLFMCATWFVKRAEKATATDINVDTKLCAAQCLAISAALF
jgi:hypothetical protein